MVSVAIAHNHPSGILEASLADKSATMRLEQLLSDIKVRLIDHYIIADGKYIGVKEHCFRIKDGVISESDL